MNSASCNRDAFSEPSDFSSLGVVRVYPKRYPIYLEGDASPCVYYILSGRVALTVTSEDAKTAVVGILSDEDFFGEGALYGEDRFTGAIALTATRVVQIERAVLLRQVRYEGSSCGEAFLDFLLRRHARVHLDLADHILNGSESRLARILFLLAKLDKSGAVQAIAPRLPQKMLAEMVGSTRGRVSFFLKHFRDHGHIESTKHGLLVRRSIIEEVGALTDPLGPARAKRLAPSSAILRSSAA